jgi:hypothetical protein
MNLETAVGAKFAEKGERRRRVTGIIRITLKANVTFASAPFAISAIFALKKRASRRQ